MRQFDYVYILKAELTDLLIQDVIGKKKESIFFLYKISLSAYNLSTYTGLTRSCRKETVL